MTENDARRVTTGFSPEKDGFAFINRFKGLPYTSALDRYVADETIHGLCGGICYTALDHYMKGIPLPDTSETPAKGSRLYKYLLERQSESWGFFWVRVLSYLRGMWWDENTALRQNERAWKKIRSRLDDGDPAVIGLVYSPASEDRDVTHNHQVIGCGYVEQSDGSARIDLYDPNYGRTQDVTLDLIPEGRGFRATQTHAGLARRVYTFFQVPYQPRTPHL